jgi:hypothetical protein
MQGQTASAKAYKREARNKKLGIVDSSPKKIQKKTSKRGPKKSNFDVDKKMNSFTGKKSKKNGKKTF